MVDPFIANGAQIELRPKRTLVGLTLGTRVNQAALCPRKGRRFGLRFQEVLTNLRPDSLQHKTQMPNDGVIAQDGVLTLL